MIAARLELKLVLDQAGVPVTLDTFSQRFNLQKRIYLIQVMGCDLGFRYGWYLRGPYSQNLTADAFTLRDELADGDEEYAKFELSPEFTGRIEKAKALWEFPNGLSVCKDEWLELLASIHYLKHIAYWPKPAAKKFEQVFTALVDTKPRFANAKIAARRAWDRLKKFGLIAAKTIS